MVDTCGRLWAVVVHAANIANGKGRLALLHNMEMWATRLEKLLGDTACNGIFAREAEEKGYLFEKAARLDEGAKIESKTHQGKNLLLMPSAG